MSGVEVCVNEEGASERERDNGEYNDEEKQRMRGYIPIKIYKKKKQS